MPYSIDEPDKLPGNIQKLSDKRKRQWINVWNSAFDACQEEDGGDCEAAAFAQANAMLTKERKANGEGGQNEAMIAFYPPPDVSQRLALSIPEAVPLADLHMTLVYLGEADEITPEKEKQIARTVSLWAKSQVPIEVRVNGLARFTKIQDDGTQPIAALLDSPYLAEFYESLRDRIHWQADFEINPRHGFMPHVTLAYMPLDTPWPIANLPELSFPLRRVVLKVGDVRYDLELTGDMQQQAETMAIRSLKAGRRNSETDMRMIQSIHDSAKNLGADCPGMMEHYRERMDEQKAIDPEELDDVFSRYKTLVNMTASELETWSETECSRKASLDRSPIRRNLRLLKRKKNEWTEGDLADANRTISFISRMKANLGGERTIKDGDGNECGTKAHISLKNWAYDSKKAAKALETRYNALKAVSRNDNEIVVANYIALWGDANGDHLNGGRDLEGVLSPRKNQDGSSGEYFTKSTKFDSDYTAADAVIVDFEHGLRPDQVGPGNDPLGRVLWKSAEIDDTGLWVQRLLNRRNKYIKMLDQMGFFENGWIGTSSQAISAKVSKSPDGEIKIWPLERDTLTVTPMEPRMISQNQLEALKTLQAEMPQLAKALGLNDLESMSEGGGGPSREEIKQIQTRLRLKQKLAM